MQYFPSCRESEKILCNRPKDQRPPGDQFHLFCGRYSKKSITFFIQEKLRFNSKMQQLFRNNGHETVEIDHLSDVRFWIVADAGRGCFAAEEDEDEGDRKEKFLHFLLTYNPWKVSNIYLCANIVKEYQKCIKSV